MTNEELLTAADKVLNSRSIVPLAAVKCAEYVRRMLDETPCDEEWFMSVFGELEIEVSYRRGVWITHCGLYAEGNIISKTKTRGQVRRLCEDLGIELREVN